MLDTIPDWSIERLTAAAYEVAARSDDYSLVGLAARIRDPVLLAATRESTVLYAEPIPMAALHPPKPKYVWKVAPELAQEAKRFVHTFNMLFGDELPTPEPANAEWYWRAHEDCVLVGRCVRLGSTPDPPVRFYHWAIARISHGTSGVVEFWDLEVWTTERFREALCNEILLPSALRG